MLAKVLVQFLTTRAAACYLIKQGSNAFLLVTVVIVSCGAIVDSLAENKGSALNPIQFEQMVMAVRSDIDREVVRQSRIVTVPKTVRVTDIRRVVSAWMVGGRMFFRRPPKTVPIVECGCGCQVSSNLVI
jgi:hypothetical protein